MKTNAQLLPNGAKRPLNCRASVSDAPCHLKETAYNHSPSSFDPTLPEDGALIIAEVLRGQFLALNDDIQTRATEAELTGAVSTLDAAIAQRVTQEELTNGMNVAVAQAASQILPQTSNVSNGVNTLSVAAYSYYDQWQMQQVLDKIDELINALRR